MDFNLKGRYQLMPFVRGKYGKCAREKEENMQVKGNLE
jgi:hypothetical protein